jgi:hypothetical protein
MKDELKGRRKRMSRSIVNTRIAGPRIEIRSQDLSNTRKERAVTVSQDILECQRKPRVLRRIFGPKREEVGSWRKLHNDELHSLYSSSNIVRVIKSRMLRWAGHVARMEEGRGVYRVWVVRPEGKRSLGRPRRRWEDNIKMDLREIGIYGANWTQLAQDRIQ